ncbi:MAG: hypothetical protein HQL69_20675 [Magnetococcales bacterium]|nr:hypothetical protein [Magnetococcales bacterium]
MKEKATDPARESKKWSMSGNRKALVNGIADLNGTMQYTAIPLISRQLNFTRPCSRQSLICRMVQTATAKGAIREFCILSG